MAKVAMVISYHFKTGEMQLTPGTGIETDPECIYKSCFQPF